jgi:ribosome biogenesis protein ENP2
MLSFHAPYGHHYSTRIPKFGRDILYHPSSCDLIVGASGSDIYRVNLEVGRFMTPLGSASPAVNKLCLNPNHGLLGSGGEDGVIECWDMRTRSVLFSF